MTTKNLIIAFAMSAVLMSCGSNERKLSGAGATFPEPFYKMAFEQAAKKTGLTVSYGGIGSGGGVRSLNDKTVDFAASDAFLKDEEMKEMGSAVLHIPTCMGGVVLAYNLEGVTSLKLDAQAIAAIFMGKITRWNDPVLQNLNPEITLPDLPITTAVRSDGSGTTAVFAEYLCKTSDAWKNTIGEGKSLNFPVGVAAKGNTGVAGVLTETKGSIGYLGSEYAASMNITTAAIQNASGAFIAANASSIAAAANGEIPADTRTSITNAPFADAYPIATFTWIILYQEQAYNGRSAAVAQNVKTVLGYLLSDEGQKVAAQTGYAPLNALALQQAKKQLEKLTYNGKPITK